MNVSALYNNMFTNANRLTNDSLAKMNMNLQSDLNSNALSNTNNSSSIGSKSSFQNIITNEIEKLNNQQIKANEMVQGFISGEVEDLHTVMIATEEARLSLELAVQVRNKVVEAYKEINNMQL